MPFFLERGLGRGIIPLFCGPNLSTEAMDQPPISSGKSSSWVEADLLLRWGEILHKKGCGSGPALSKGNSPWPVLCLSDLYLSSAEPGVVVMRRSVPQDPEPPNLPMDEETEAQMNTQIRTQSRWTKNKDFPTVTHYLPFPSI